tara:strand:- start:441 stop:632 length:192 start_codon:yes stop_codon:yes gene_type:complete
MKRQDILGCLSQENGDDELEMYINEIEEKFNKIRNLLDDIDIRNLDNIVKASEIATSMGNELY